MYLTSFVKMLPVIFISLIVCWSYYAYVVAVILTVMTDVTEQVICGIIFHMITLMFVWSYYMIVFSPPGSVPVSWKLSQEKVDQLSGAKSEEEWKEILADMSRSLGCTVKQRSVQNAVRYCEKCLCIKPDRSHHCSVCDVCTLKMDHHCPWVNNCVGFANYKFFVSILFCLSISSLFGYHIWLVLHNRTTLEQFRAPMFENNLSDPNGWSLGKMNNLREVFGTSAWLWLIPVKSYL